MTSENYTHFLEIDFVVSGIGIQNPYAGKALSLEKTEAKYRGEVLRNCLRFRYRVDIDSENGSLGQENIEQIIVDERDIFLQILALVVARPFYLLAYQAMFDGKVIEPNSPVRKIPSGLYNLISLWKRPNINYQYVAVMHNDSWTVLEMLVSEFRRDTPLHRRLTLPLRWFAKGSNETNSIDRLVAFWICFNALYEDPNIRSERKSIEKYVGQSVDSIIAQRYIGRNYRRLISLSKFPIQLRGGCKIARELHHALTVKPMAYEKLVEFVALTLYGVRNNLFHGDCDPNSHNDQRMVEYSERLLSELMQEFIGREVLKKPLPHRRFVIQEKFGF